MYIHDDEGNRVPIMKWEYAKLMATARELQDALELIYNGVSFTWKQKAAYQRIIRDLEVIRSRIDDHHFMKEQQLSD